MKIIHLSDLHFGTEEARVVKVLQDEICEIAPDLVIVSGDFTQIGNEEEFRFSKDFLDALNVPHLCVPGNHDVPVYNLVERFVNPYKNYRKFINEDLEPRFTNDQVLIAGINSSRRALPHWNWANGAVSAKQCEDVRGFYEQNQSRVGQKQWRIAVLHHPVHKVQDMPIDVTVFGRKRAVQCFEDLNVDLILTGHVHYASITMLGDHTHQNVYVSASTALSSRTRGQENGFNVITLGDDQVDIEVFVLDGDGFENIRSYNHKVLNLFSKKAAHHRRLFVKYGVNYYC